MEFLHQKVADEFSRCAAHLGKEDLYDGKFTIGLFDVLRAHYAIVDYFYGEGYGVGGIGPRDINLLHSALHRQFVGWGSARKWTDNYDIVATVMYGLIMDHPFHDANKRTAFLVSIYHLDQKLGFWPSSSYKEFENFVVDIAEHNLRGYPAYTHSKHLDEHDKVVECIAAWLRRNTRKVDRAQKSITFWQLNSILKNSGYSLMNQSSNHIEVHKHGLTRGILGIGQKPFTERLGVVVCRGWKTKVPKGVLNEVRKLTKLDPDHHIDSKVFFGDADQMFGLITEFEGPLKRLADR